MEEINQSVIDHAPTLLFHTEDARAVRPVSIEFFAQHSTDGQGNQIRLPLDRPTTMHPRHDAWYKRDDNPQTYYRVYEWDDDHYAILYVWLYMVNPGYTFAGAAIRQSFHTGDVEHVTMVVRKNDHALVRAYYAAHGGDQGQWVDASDLSAPSPTDRLKVYVAKGSQASMSKPGTQFRLFGVTNDKCDAKGGEYDTRHSLTLMEGHWLRSKLGTTDGPGLQDWFDREDGVSISALGRFLGTFACH